MDKATAPEIKGSWHNPQHNDWLIHGSVLSFPPELAIEAVGVNPPSVDGRLLGLLGPYHQHAIGTFNICSRVPTHQSLTDTGEGYNLGGAILPHHTARPSQPMVFTFHLRASPSLQLNQVLPTKPKFEFNEPMAATWSSDHLTIYRGLLLCLPISNDLSLAIGFTRIDRKVNLMPLGHQFNSYNIMHIKES
jgi:hypothetical protein